MALREKAIEAAARAMCREDGEDPDREGPEAVRNAYAAYATATLDAILFIIAEPDGAIMEAGSHMTDDEGDARRERARGVWVAMIRKLQEV